jgi:hypothetical protein
MICHSMGAAMRRFPALLNIKSEITSNKRERRHEYFILVPHSSSIDTKASLLVEQSLTLGTLLVCANRVVPRSPTPMSLELQAEEVGTHQFRVGDDEDEANGGGELGLP